MEGFSSGRSIASSVASLKPPHKAFSNHFDFKSTSRWAFAIWGQHTQASTQSTDWMGRKHGSPYIERLDVRDLSNPDCDGLGRVAAIDGGQPKIVFRVILFVRRIIMAVVCVHDDYGEPAAARWSLEREYSLGRPIARGAAARTQVHVPWTLVG